jgi:glycosyltransferase involved in cell wall biosynthesis
MVRAHLLSSVRVGVVSDLAVLWRAQLGIEAEVVSSLSDADWREQRAGGRASSLRARVRGLLFPLVAPLPPRGSADVLVATTNPFWLPWVVTLRRPRAAVVTLVYDVYPDAIEARWRLPRLLRWPFATIVASGLRRSAAVVVLGEQVRRALTARWSLSVPVTVIPTGADPQTFVDAVDRSDALPDTGADRVVLSYVGNTGSMHDGATLGAALAAALAANPRTVTAIVATRGDRSEELLAPLRGLANAQLAATLDDDVWAWLMRRSDIALVTLDGRAGLASMPSKTYPALAAGCAVLAIAPDGSDLAALVRDHGAGLVVAPGDVQGATVALTALVEDVAMRTRLGASARAAAEHAAPAALARAWSDVLGPLIERAAESAPGHGPGPKVEPGPAGLGSGR